MSSSDIRIDLLNQAKLKPLPRKVSMSGRSMFRHVISYSPEPPAFIIDVETSREKKNIVGERVRC